MRRIRPFVLFGLAVLAATPEPIAGQESIVNAIISAEDSTRLLAAARSDQSAFERLRRRNLPDTWGRTSSVCDERIGRFCMTHSSNRSSYVAPPEADEIVAARLTLIDGLNRVAELIPGDEWVTGQRVRYLVEARRFDDAIEAAGECRAEPGWCAALAGFAFHNGARPLQADSAFTVALAAMDAEEREDWEDLTLILDAPSVRRYRRMESEGQAAFAERFWRLSDPLFTRPGNELWSEHMSRHVWNQLQYRAQQTEGISWGWDLREILIRYGWPSSWEQVREWRMSLSQGPPSLISHYGGAPQDLLPPNELLLDESLTEGQWDVEDEAARTGYNIPLPDSVARWFNPLHHQLAAFRRGDSIRIVAGYEMPADSMPEGTRVRAGLGVLPLAAADSDPIVAIEDDAPSSGRLVTMAPYGPLLVSVEAIAPTERRIARARHGIEVQPIVPGLMALSDLLLLDGADEMPETFEEAVAIARGSSRIESGEELAIYWEIYGVDPIETPEMTISMKLLGGRAGWLRRLAERAGILREVQPASLRWQEPVVEGEYMPRSIDLTIPEVSPGVYTLELSVQAPGREALVVRKDVEVLE